MTGLRGEHYCSPLLFLNLNKTSKQAELLSDRCLADLKEMIAMTREDNALWAESQETFPQLVLKQIELTVSWSMTANRR
jgi:hypothetical protein